MLETETMAISYQNPGSPLKWSRQGTRGCVEAMKQFRWWQCKRTMMTSNRLHLVNWGTGIIYHYICICIYIYIYIWLWRTDASRSSGQATLNSCVSIVYIYISIYQLFIYLFIYLYTYVFTEFLHFLHAICHGDMSCSMHQEIQQIYQQTCGVWTKEIQLATCPLTFQLAWSELLPLGEFLWSLFFQQHKLGVFSHSTGFGAGRSSSNPHSHQEQVPKQGFQEQVAKQDSQEQVQGSREQVPMKQTSWLWEPGDHAAFI